ncbi:hypothetical protein M9H77_31252 [Catharanthus roseus]|uniref:Uncharacterized protein n=1 Tax=Catharanthus roseus TaxID=4058 RepID=A0ACC0A1E2_CATRO|nr:hypothetical protein M9H77_31252 [Catharanthus roseus]
MWSKIYIFLGFLVESCYVERVRWISCSLCGDFYAKFKGELVENYDYVSSFLCTSMKIFTGIIPSIQFLCFVSHQLEFPYDEQKVLNVDKFLKALIENIHGFQFYHFHFKEFMWLLVCGKKMSSSFKLLKAHLCDLEKAIFENGVFELNLKNLVEKHLVYYITFIDFILKDDILVQNINSCGKLLNQSFVGTLLYYFTFKEMLDELIFKEMFVLY